MREELASPYRSVLMSEKDPARRRALASALYEATYLSEAHLGFAWDVAMPVLNALKRERGQRR
jgi:hypothetical protein